MFWRYVLVQVVALVASGVIVGVLVSRVGIAAFPAFVVTALVLGLASYLIHQWWTFSTRSHSRVD
jgi:putative flippase GtrA